MDRGIETILNDPGASYWLKNALKQALERDPVDAMNDAKVLAEVLEHQARSALASTPAVWRKKRYG